MTTSGAWVSTGACVGISTGTVGTCTCGASSTIAGACVNVGTSATVVVTTVSVTGSARAGIPALTAVNEIAVAEASATATPRERQIPSGARMVVHQHGARRSAWNRLAAAHSPASLATRPRTWWYRSVVARVASCAARSK